MRKIIDMVRDKKNVSFAFYRDKALHYKTEDGFLFPVPVNDAGSATFNSEEKAIVMMRYIRKHLENIQKEK